MILFVCILIIFMQFIEGHSQGIFQMFRLKEKVAVLSASAYLPEYLPFCILFYKNSVNFKNADLAKS